MLKVTPVKDDEMVANRLRMRDDAYFGRQGMVWFNDTIGGRRAMANKRNRAVLEKAES